LATGDRIMVYARPFTRRTEKGKQSRFPWQSKPRRIPAPSMAARWQLKLSKPSRSFFQRRQKLGGIFTAHYIGFRHARSTS
jgi:hypothetical protein